MKRASGKTDLDFIVEAGKIIIEVAGKQFDIVDTGEGIEITKIDYDNNNRMSVFPRSGNQIEIG